MEPSEPKVVKWFKAYCWVLVAVYSLVAVSSLMLFFADPDDTEMDRTFQIVFGLIMLTMGAGLMTIFLMGIFLKPRPWVWVFNFALICIGMTSACFAPACIAMLIYWIKEDTKQFYNSKF